MSDGEHSYRLLNSLAACSGSRGSMLPTNSQIRFAKEYGTGLNLRRDGLVNAFKTRIAVYKFEGDVFWPWWKPISRAKGVDAWSLLYLGSFQRSTAAGTAESMAENFRWCLHKSILDHSHCLQFTDVAQLRCARNIEILRDRDTYDRHKSGDRYQSATQQNNYRGHDQKNNRQGSDRQGGGGECHRSAGTNCLSNVGQAVQLQRDCQEEHLVLVSVWSMTDKFIDQLQAPKHFSNNDFTIEVPSVSSERSRTFPRLLFSHTYGHYEFMVMPYWSSTKLQPEFYGLDEPIVHEFLDKVRPIEFIGEINTKIPSANFGDKVAFLVSHYFRQRNYYGSAKPYPSTKLMRKGPEVLYGTKSEENSFEELKQCLVSEPILTTLHLVSCGFQILYDAFKISTNLGKANVVAEVFELEVGMIDGIKVEEEIIRLTKLCLPEILHFRESLMTEAHCSHIFDSSRKVLQKAWGTRLKIRTDFHPEPDDSRSKKLRNAQTRQKITPTDHSVAEALEFSRVNMFLENIHLHVESGVLVSRASLCQRFHRTSLRLLESRCEVPIVWRYHPQLSHVTQSVSCIITHSYNIILFTISLSIDSDPEDLSYTEEP
ncbi:hypothetical protein Tco_1107757 [Tanacetum coccineum]